MMLKSGNPNCNYHSISAGCYSLSALLNFHTVSTMTLSVMTISSFVDFYFVYE